jgi:hypothetical protein
MNNPEPPNAAEVSKVIAERLDARESSGSLQETVTIDWRGRPLSVPVITMPVGLLSYNPSTHRIRAQRSINPELEKEVDTNPFSSKAQDYLQSLLKCDPTDPAKVDPSYVTLKEDLKLHGQSDPGIITRAGVLVNGNTRQVALKELGQKHIRVGVLPSDTSIDDIQAIELALQLRKDHKRDYSFMNLLLAIDERVGSQLATDIQREFRIKSASYDRYRWILEFVRDAIRRSTVEIDGVTASLNLADFESHQGKLEELHRAYAGLKPKSPDDAEALREQRLLALSLGKSKTDLRLIEPDFSASHMKGLIPDVPIAPMSKIPGLDIEVRGPSQEVEKLKAFTTQHLRAKAVAKNHGAIRQEHVSKAHELLKATDEALDKGLDRAGKQVRVIKKRYAAADRVSDAVDDLKLATAAVVEARSTANFDPSDLDEALVDLRSSLVSLSLVVARESDSTLEGILWMRSIGEIEARKS